MNLFADHMYSSPCSRLLWGAPGMRRSASISTIDFHHFCVSGLRLGLGLGLGQGIVLGLGMFWHPKVHAMSLGVCLQLSQRLALEVAAALQSDEARSPLPSPEGAQEAEADEAANYWRQALEHEASNT